jgi:hypothetical protein
MPFVKLDCNILNSSLWIDRDAREIFITALLMAVPTAYDEDIEELEIIGHEVTGLKLPPGEYGFVAAASVGICRQACVDQDKGIAALVRLSQPEPESRTPDFDGRRMIRVDGGFLILNFRKYRDKDHTAAERQRRYRERKRHGVTSQGNGVTERDVTQAEAEAEADKENKGTKVPFQAIVDLYHKHCPDLPRVKVLSAKRKAHLRSRWKTFDVVRGIGAPGEALELIKFDNLENWERYFKFITDKCPFMTGKNDRAWVADFDFCIRESAMVSVMENKYVERK